jgi:hypothetical protein
MSGKTGLGGCLECKEVSKFYTTNVGVANLFFIVSLPLLLTGSVLFIDILLAVANSVMWIVCM